MAYSTSLLFERFLDNTIPQERIWDKLQTYCLVMNGYKVVAKVTSHRVEQVIGLPIQVTTQQGFVHDRHTVKTVMTMMAHLSLAMYEPKRMKLKAE